MTEAAQTIYSDPVGISRIIHSLEVSNRRNIRRNVHGIVKRYFERTVFTLKETSATD
jgi:hypothetical protein